MSLPKLLVATRNRGKLLEYRQLLQAVPFELVSLEDVGITLEVEETGETFEENAWLKARAYAACSGLTTLADDSGLEVDFLDGEPGVRSARFGDNPSFTDRDRVDLLLQKLEGIPWEQRTARFRCEVAIIRPKIPSTPLYERGEKEDGDDGGGDRGDCCLVVGTVTGMIQYTPQGSGGFGYDPIFFLPSYGKTMAELPMEEKNRISHRANAARQAAVVLRNWR